MALQNQIRYLFAADTTVADGTGKTGLVYSGITAKYLVDGGTIQSLTVETISTLGTYSAPTSEAHIRFKELAATDPTKGIYEIHFHNTQLATGSRLWLFLSASGAKFQPLEINLLEQTGDNYARIGAAGAGLTALGDTRIANLDAAVSTRLAAASYTAPPSAAANASQVRTELTTELGRIDAAVSSRLASASYSAPDNYTISVINSWLQDDTYGLPMLLAAISSRLASASYTAPDNAGIATVVGVANSIDGRLPSDPADASVIAAAFVELANAIAAIEVGSAGGGGTLYAQIAHTLLTTEGFLEIIQGEEKTLTIIVEADGQFVAPSATSISVTFGDPSGETIVKSNSDVTRVTEELDVQVLRVTLTPEETEILSGGLLRVEIAFDNQKAVLTHSVKIIEAI